MSRFFSPAEVPGNASSEEKHAKNTVVIIDLKTTSQDFSKDSAAMKEMINSSSLCIPGYVRSMSPDYAVELAIPACPTALDQP